MARTVRLGRLGLVVWLIAPVVLVWLLWTQMDRSRGKPDPRFVHKSVDAGATPPQPSPSPAVTPSVPPSHLPPPPPAPAPAPSSPPPAQPTLVEPESLPQGYVVVVTDAAKLANSSSPIHLASSHNGWNPSDPTQKLTARSDGRWQIVMDKPRLDSRLAFKFTRGNWDTVEVSEELKDVDNRLLPMIDASKLAPDEKPIIEFTVPRWADQKPRGGEANNPYRAVKVAGGTVQRLQVVGLGGARDLIVWLPPGYADASAASRSFPVLYMQDGQNLFDTRPGALPPDEWRMDETATELIAAGAIEPLIVVGIPHAGNDRIAEYLPTPAIDDVTPRGDAYVEFVVGEVMPRVERAFRVKRGPDHTAIGGSSLGGLISLYAGLKRPDVFGKVLAESPSVRLRGKDIWKPAFDGLTTGPRVIFLGMGGKELGDGPDAAEENQRVLRSLAEFKDWLAARKIGEEVDAVIEPDARHTEAAWAARLPRALKALFPANP